MKSKFFLSTFFFISELIAFAQQGAQGIESIGINEISIIEIQPNGDVWAGSNGQGVAFYNADSARWFYYTNANTPQLANDTVTAIHVRAIGGVEHAFVGTTGGATNFSGLSGASVIPNLPETNVKAIVYKPDSLWILTTTKLARYDSSVAHQNDYTPTFSPISCTVRGENQCGGIWFGTANNGLYYTPNGTDFSSYIDTTPPHQKLVDNRVNAIAIDNQCNAKFVGTKGGFSVCPVGNPCQNFTTANGLPQNDITSVAMVCGKVWLGTRDSGIVIFSPPSTFTRFTTANGLTDNHIASVSGLNNNCTAYVASVDGNIAVVDSAKNIVQVLTGLKVLSTKTVGVRVYPQPTSGQVNFAFNENIENGELRISDVNGRLLKSISVRNNNQLTADLSAFENGIYIYQLSSNNLVVKTGKLEIIK